MKRLYLAALSTVCSATMAGIATASPEDTFVAGFAVVGAMAAGFVAAGIGLIAVVEWIDHE